MNPSEYGEALDLNIMSHVVAFIRNIVDRYKLKVSHLNNVRNE